MQEQFLSISIIIENADLTINFVHPEPDCPELVEGRIATSLPFMVRQGSPEQGRRAHHERQNIKHLQVVWVY